MNTVRSRALFMSFLVLVLTACSSGAPSASTPAASEPAASAAPASEPAASESAAGGGELIIWADEKRAKALKPLADQFGAENGVTVKIQSVSKDLIANFKTASQAGTGPDIVIWAHDVLGDLVANGYVDPVTLPNPGDFEDLAIKGMTFDGQLYGVPYNVENIALFRNPELSPDVPANMEALVEAGTLLVADNKATEIMALQVGQTGDPYHIFPVFSSGGGALFGKTPSGDPDPDQVLIDSPGSIAAGEKIKAMGEKGAKALKTSIDGTNAIPLFFNKKTAFLVSGPWAVADIVKAGTPYDISPIPAFADGTPAGPFIGVNGFYVASKGKNKAIAQEFATNFATTEEVQLALYEAEPRPPALKSAAATAAAGNPDMGKLATAREGGTILPAVPAMGKVWGPMGIAEAAIVKGGDVKKILDAAGKAIRDAIAAG